MKRIVVLFLTMILLTGCGGAGDEMDAALQLRSQCLGAQTVSFRAEMTADYIDTMEQFTLSCEADSDGVITFCVEEPEEISGITGTVSGQEGALTFDEKMIAFPLMADERLSPISGPFVMMKALRSGVITACVREDEQLHVTINDSYSDDPLTVEIWAQDDQIKAAEISWQGRRFLSMQIEEYGCE